MAKRLPVCETEMMTIPHVTKANFIKYGAKLLDITIAFSAERLGMLLYSRFLLCPSCPSSYFRYLVDAVIISERQAMAGNIDDDFQDLSQIPPSDVTGPPVQQSPYFNAGRRSGGGGGGYKRKRGGGGRSGGEKKLTKKGKWLGKKTSGDKKVPFSAHRSSSAGSSFGGTTSQRPSATGAGYRAAPSSSRSGGGGGGSGGAMGLLAPPRPKTVKKE